MGLDQVLHKAQHARHYRIVFEETPDCKVQNCSMCAGAFSTTHLAALAFVQEYISNQAVPTCGCIAW